MDNRYANYFFHFSHLLLMTLLLVGLVDFVIKGEAVATIDKGYFGVAFGLPYMAVRTASKGWGKIRHVALLFLFFYVPSKLVTLFGVQEVVLAMVPYSVVLFVCALMVLTGFYLKKAIKKN